MIPVILFYFILFCLCSRGWLLQGERSTWLNPLSHQITRPGRRGGREQRGAPMWFTSGHRSVISTRANPAESLVRGERYTGVFSSSSSVQTGAVNVPGLICIAASSRKLWLCLSSQLLLGVTESVLQGVAERAKVCSENHLLTYKSNFAVILSCSISVESVFRHHSLDGFRWSSLVSWPVLRYVQNVQWAMLFLIYNWLNLCCAFVGFLKGLAIWKKLISQPFLLCDVKTAIIFSEKFELVCACY